MLSKQLSYAVARWKVGPAPLKCSLTLNAETPPGIPGRVAFTPAQARQIVLTNLGEGDTVRNFDDAARIRATGVVRSLIDTGFEMAEIAITMKRR